ncbi:MAG: DUF4136 domain-containing protein [Thermoanaerobaculia bacterium]
MVNRRITLALAAVAAVGVASCSTLKTSVDYKPGTSFSQYRTFGFKDVDEIRNNILDARIKAALTTQLTAKGLTRNDGSPDLWIVPHPRLSKQTQINTYNTGWGYGWGWRGGMGGSTSTVEQIPVGTLIIDLVDSKANELVWRGTASETLKESSTPQEREKDVNDAMAKLFEGFPPK